MKVIVISASSDIGAALCKRWVPKGWTVIGTYRNDSAEVERLRNIGVHLVRCDLMDRISVVGAIGQLIECAPDWDVLVMAPGAQEPVGPFIKCDFDEWAASNDVNFVNQMRVVHALLPVRNPGNVLGPCVLFFAGGGANNAVVNYSAYTVSKIALIKMCELLDAEIPDTRFAIIGPGWVKTKIHQATLEAGETYAGANYQRTLCKLASEECTPMNDVLDSCDWVISMPRVVVSGRNFSTVYDRWGTEELAELLRKDPNLYKLRRYGNERLIAHRTDK